AGAAVLASFGAGAAVLASFGAGAAVLASFGAGAAVLASFGAAASTSGDPPTRWELLGCHGWSSARAATAVVPTGPVFGTRGTPGPPVVSPATTSWASFDAAGLASSASTKP